MIEATPIAEVWLFTPKIHADERGWFSEVYSQRTLADALGTKVFVQDNHSASKQPGTVRGLHFQAPPMAQDKLIRVLRGAIKDVAVDIRRNSPTYGQHVSAVLDAKQGRQIFVPKGFAHGFVTLEPDTEVFYKVTEFYSAEHDRGLLWSDPELKIDWGFSPENAILSDKDKHWPRLSESAAIF